MENVLLLAIEKYFITFISIGCCLLGFWMGRRTRGVQSEPSNRNFDWRRYIKKDAQPEPETDILNDAMGSADDDFENRAKIPTIIGDGRTQR